MVKKSRNQSRPITLRQFLKGFDFSKPDWSRLPGGFPECDLDGLSSVEIGKFSAIRSLWELTLPEKPRARSRVWQSSNGYIYLVPWSNANLLRVLGRKFTDRLSFRERRLKAQLDDALRSSVANIEEGFARPTTREYLDFLGYSQASLKEAKGDFQRSRQDGFLRSVPGSSLAEIGIDLKDWHEALKKSVISLKILQNPSRSFKGDYRRLKEVRRESFTFGYPPVDNLKASDLTYEICIEIVNPPAAPERSSGGRGKTDWHLRD